MINMARFQSAFAVVAVLGLLAGVFGAFPAYAAGVPTVATNNVWFESSTVVTFYGVVNANDLPTDAWFEYDTTQSLGLRTTSQSVSGQYAVTMSAQASNLQPNTVYYYRAVAQNSSGKVYGEIRSFTTLPDTNNQCNLSSITTDNASVNGDTVTFYGTVTPYNSNSSVYLTYYFQYGASYSFGQSTPTQTTGSIYARTSVNTSVSGLTQNSVYYYRLVVRNSCGNDSFGQTLSFTTGNSAGGYINPNPWTNPNGYAPTVVTKPVTARTSNSLTFYGTANPNNSATSAWFEYGISSSNLTRLPSRFIGDGSGEAFRSTTVLSLVSGTTYYYRLGAQNSYGVNYGSVLSATTDGEVPPITPPVTPPVTPTVTPTSTPAQTGSPVILATPTFADSEVKAGRSTTYTLNIRNIGIASAFAVAATIVLPAELEFVDSDPGVASRTGDTFIVNLGTINAEEGKDIVMNFRANSDITSGTNVRVSASVDYSDAQNQVQAVAATETISIVKKSKSVFASIGSVFGKLGNIPGYVWFFVFLLAIILAVTWIFFKKLRGGEEDESPAEVHL